jgi:hypothetical protein
VVDKPDNTDWARDARGRFGPGNPGGPGGSRKKALILRKAAEDAITPEVIAGLIKRAARKGLEHCDIAAIRLVFERTVGRVAPAPAETEPLALVLPPLKTVKDCATASQRILDAIVAGTLDPPIANAMNNAVATRLKAIEMTELTQRIEELEQKAKHAAEQ